MKEKLFKFLSNPRYIAIIYVIVSALSAISKYNRGPEAYNNYIIFKNVFYNALNAKNLFLYYSELYKDHNLYGILFAVIIAPFAILPDWLGMILWNVFNAGLLIFSFSKLPISSTKKSLLGWLCLQEFITSSVSFQFNIALVGLLILSATYIYEKKEIQSVTAILIGTFVKIYGIVGLSSFLFVKNKIKFISFFLILSIFFFLLPMFFFGQNFTIQSYSDWFHTLTEKNSLNQALGSRQDYSLMGIVRRFLGNANISNIVFLVPGAIVFMLPYLRVKQYKSQYFQLLILSSTLLFIVLFSSGSESSTYIIAVSGVMIWFVIQRKRNFLIWFLLIFVIVLTCFSFSDLFPKSVKENYIMKYSLKALPCSLVWFRIIYELMTRDFQDSKNYTLI